MPATLEVLPEIIDAVQGRAEVVVDGGFVYGSDVVKALALGARAVGVGKLIGWGLGAGGEAGLEHALLLLRDEIRDVMASLGLTGVDQLTTACLRRAVPVPDDAWIGFAHSTKSVRR
jgi:isopentenyl diphosphate isomerase/L-lactate dehydrogenase-like FMN-dependent dehydrogenase